MINKFDDIAPIYDAHFTYSEIGKKQRNLVYNHLKSLLPTNKKWDILEVNGGTGEDSIWLAEKGHQVLCTDISEGMIEQARKKTTSSNLHFETLDINTLQTKNFDTKFDLILSNFGGLNCLSPSDLKSFINNTVSLLKKDGRLILVIMPKNCLWENLFFSLKREWKKVGRRKKEFVLANVGKEKVKTFYYNPLNLKEETKGLFINQAIKPIGLFVPPSYLEPLFKNRSSLLNLFFKLDLFLQPISILSKYLNTFVTL